MGCLNNHNFYNISNCYRMDFAKFEKITGKKIHHQFLRNLVNFDKFGNDFLKLLENNEKFYLIYLYSPTKPSLNLNDVNQFLFLKWLQDVLNVPLIIHINDNHRFLKHPVNMSDISDLGIDLKEFSIKHFQHFLQKTDAEITKIPLKQLSKQLTNDQGHVKEEFKLKFVHEICRNCIDEIVSLGFRQSQTFICLNLQYIGQCGDYYKAINRLGAKITFRHSALITPMDYSDDIESISLVAKDMAALFAYSYPTVLHGPDNRNQRPPRAVVINLSRPQLALSRRLAREMNWPRPLSLTIESLPGLHGNGPMDSLAVNSAIFFSDTPKIIRNKITKLAFSGGRDTIEEHRRLGGDCDRDVSIQYLRFILGDEDNKNQGDNKSTLELLEEQYRSGSMLTGELKAKTIEVLTKLLTNFQDDRKRRKATTNDGHIKEKGNDDLVTVLMTPRPLEWFRTGSTIDQCDSLDLEIDLHERNEEEEREKCEEREKQSTERAGEGKQIPNNDVVEDVEVGGDIVTPWEVVGSVDTGIDYDKLIELYGSSKIGQDLVDRFERVTSQKAHYLLRRGMFYSHRDFHEILDMHEKGQPFFLYTGRGPSSDALHLGHMIPFVFTKWLQDIFQVPLVIQLTDDEKCLMRNITQDEVRRMTVENARDIIAVGFDVRNTFIFSDFEYMSQGPAFFETSIRVGSKVNFSTVKSIFGFTVDDSVEKIAFPSKQAAPSFSPTFPWTFGTNHRMKCLIPCAIDQDPYFRMTRDVAPRLNMPKPGLIHSRFFPSLQGNRTKMNASDPNSAIFMTDSAGNIHDKIMNHAFSVSEERKRGLTADEISRYDICYQYLTFFLDDDDKLERLKTGLGDSSISDRQLREELITALTPFVETHKSRRELVTDEVVRQFMTPRQLK